MDYFVQCKLKKGTTWMVSTIPEKFAIKGKFLKLKDADDNWEDGWEVVETYTKFPKDAVLLNEMQHRFQREATDI